MTLTEAYADFNWRWFGGRLPVGTRVKWVRHSAMREMGDYGQGVIRLNDRMKGWPSAWKTTLLHEMLHVLVDEVVEADEGDHGRQWKRERHRLYRRGAFEEYL